MTLKQMTIALTRKIQRDITTALTLKQKTTALTHRIQQREMTTALTLKQKTTALLKQMTTALTGRFQGTRRSVVYFVCSTTDCPQYGDITGLHLWSIFCVDLKSKVDSSTSLQPKVRLCEASFETPAFCIFESTLYVFDGFIHDYKGQGQSIYSYKLKPEDSGLLLSKSMMMKAGEMNNVKYIPMAIVTPDGRRIIVYSLLTNMDFEMFNPIDGKCEKLPQINCGEGSMISSCAFVSNYVLLVQTKMSDEYGGQRSFTLDLKDPQHWKECVKPMLQFHTSIFAKNILLTPIGGYFISEDEVAHGFDELRMGSYLYPEISSHDLFFRSMYGAITLIEDEDENGSCEFCILDIALERRDELEWPMYIPHITLDVYRCDLNLCRQEMKRMNDLKMGPEYSGHNEWKRLEAFMLPGATKRKSIELCLQPQKCDHLSTLTCSSYNGYHRP